MITLFLANHPYLICNLLGLIPLTAIYTALPDQRRNILVAGLFWIPLAPLAVLHEDYWNPSRLFGLRFGIEDALYLFNVNAMGWAVPFGLTAKRLQFNRSELIDFRRLAELVAVGLVLSALLLPLRLKGMTFQVIVNAGVGLWILARRRSYWPITLTGLLLLPLIFLSELKLWLTLWPDFAAAWSPAKPWGHRFAGLPLGEIVFYLSFSIVSPISVAFCRGLTLSPGNNPRFLHS